MCGLLESHTCRNREQSDGCQGLQRVQRWGQGREAPALRGVSSGGLMDRAVTVVSETLTDRLLNLLVTEWLQWGLGVSPGLCGNYFKCAC